MVQGTQSFANHARMRPAFHIATFLPLLAVLIWSAVLLMRRPSQEHAMLFVLSLLLAAVAFWARLFALGVQDRVIRNEERIRLARLLPDDLRGRIEELTLDQLLALRFASDGEVAALTRRVLDERIAERKAIKALVREWRGDHQRI